MSERILFSEQEKVPIEALEALLHARLGWINSAVSPFAVADHQARLNKAHAFKLHHLKNPYRFEKELQLTG
jgi:hypothetical protein